MESLIECIYYELLDSGEIDSDKETIAEACLLEKALEKAVQDKKRAGKLVDMVCSIKAGELRQGFKHGFKAAFRLFNETMDV